VKKSCPTSLCAGKNPVETQTSDLIGLKIQADRRPFKIEVLGYFYFKRKFIHSWQ
jgi:hypothetical protein